MGNFLSNNCRFCLSFVICLFTCGLANGSILPPAVVLPIDPRELAEYNFNLAQAYEAWGWVGKAHLHYEIVHDCYPHSQRYQESTRRMLLLRRRARKLTSVEPNYVDLQKAVYSIPSIFSGIPCEADVMEIGSPTLNPFTFMAIDTIWATKPKDENSFASLSIYVDEDRTSSLPTLNDRWDPSTLADIPFTEGSFQLLDSPFFNFKRKAENGSGALVF
jgi:hypothetical protein